MKLYKALVLRCFRLSYEFIFHLDLINFSMDASLKEYEFRRRFIGLIIVVCWLNRRKTRIRIPCQASKQNMEKNIFRQFSLSRLLVKTRGNNPPVNVSQKSDVRSQH